MKIDYPQTHPIPPTLPFRSSVLVLIIAAIPLAACGPSAEDLQARELAKEQEKRLRAELNQRLDTISKERQTLNGLDMRNLRIKKERLIKEVEDQERLLKKIKADFDRAKSEIQSSTP